MPGYLSSWGLNQCTSDHATWCSRIPQSSEPDWAQWHSTDLACLKQISYTKRATGGMRAEGLNLGVAPLIIPLGSSIQHQYTRIPQSSSLTRAQWGIPLMLSCLQTTYFIYKRKRPLGGWELRDSILEPHLWSYLLAPAFSFKPEFLNPQACLEHSGIPLVLAA